MGCGGRSTKKILAQGKIKWKKIHARQLILKNIHAMAEKKNPPRNLITKKILAARKFPSPCHNFSKGPSLNRAGGAAGRLKPNQKKGAKIKGGKFSRLPRCLFILSVDEWEGSKFILNQLDVILAFSYKNGLWNYETEFWFQIIRFLLFFFSDWNGIISLRQQQLDGDRQTSLETEAVDWTWKWCFQFLES